MSDRLEELLEKESLTDEENLELQELIKLDMLKDNAKFIPSYEEWVKLNNEVKDLQIKRRVLELQKKKKIELDKIKRLESERDGLEWCKTCEKMVDPKSHYQEKIYCDDCQKMEDHKHFE